MKTLFLSLILLASQGLLAQIQPQLQSGPVSADPSSWVSLTAQVPGGLPNRVVIQASLHQDGVETWSGTSIPLGLTRGRWQILPGQLRWAMQSDATGIAGKGLFCIQILSDPGAQYLGEACVELEINNTNGVVGANRYSPLQKDNDSFLQLPGLDSLPAFSTLIPSGNVELFGQSANQPMPLTDFPRHFAGVRGHAAVNTFGMPFRADLNWILAADQPVPPAWNQLSFSLDPLAMKDSIRQQILDAAETDPEAWKGRFNALREEKISGLREQYKLPAAFSQADSLLNQQIQRGQIVGRMERMLSDSDLAQTKANWESRLSDLGLHNEQQIGAYLDSLRAFDAGAYEEWLKEYARLGQVEAMEEKIAAYRQDSTWLPDWQQWEDKKEKIASWQEADG